MSPAAAGWLAGLPGVELLLRGIAVAAAAAFACRLLPARAAGARAAVWQVAVVVLASLPLLVAVLPGWRVDLPLPAGGELRAWHAPPSAVPAAAAPGCSGERSGCVAGAPRTGRVPAAGAVLLCVWALGALAVALRAAGGVLQLRALAGRAGDARDAGWLPLLASAQRELGLRRPVRLLVAPAETAVLTWGVWRPAILLPASSHGWCSERRRAVILHELQHVRRLDALYDVAAQLALAIHWPNPLAWYAVRRLRSERERVCDRAVVAAGIPAVSYAGHLLALARGANPAAAAGVATMAAETGLEGRILALMREDGPPRETRRLTCIAVAFAAVLGLGSVTARPQATHDSPGRSAAASASGTWQDAAWLSAHYGIPPTLAGAICGAAEAEGVDCVLAHALVHAQSGFDRRTRGTGVGLTGITPSTAASLVPGTSAAHLADDEINLRLGLRYLRHLIGLYGGRVDMALAAYHLGPGAVEARLGNARSQAGP